MNQYIPLFVNRADLFAYDYYFVSYLDVEAAEQVLNSKIFRWTPKFLLILRSFIGLSSVIAILVVIIICVLSVIFYRSTILGI